MRLQVAKIETIAEGIKSFELRDPSGANLPPFESGAHLQLNLAPGLTRRYSIISDPYDLSHYTIAVLHREGGQGSSFLHRVRPGGMIDAKEPKNGFPLEEARHTILIAGGIGVTPIFSHVRELARRGASFEVHYAARERDRMALRESLAEHSGTRGKYYASADGERLKLPALLAAPAPGTHIYVCGPKGLLDAVRETAAQQGWGREQVHFESFGAAWQATDEPVHLELTLSGLSIDVPVGQTLLEAMEAAGVWAPSDCRRGECYRCITQVVEGEPIHRDRCLTAEDRATAITPCISWARGGRLVLEI